MTNHVHLIVVPQRIDSLELALKQTHGRYATYFNARYESTGHVWQGRYYSCPLDRAHLWRALRYTELNPVRAGLVTEPVAYQWSSAAVHCGGANRDTVFSLAPWPEPWSANDWFDYLGDSTAEGEANAIRQNTHTGRPLGDAEFIRKLEGLLGRKLEPETGGRPRKAQGKVGQEVLVLE